MAHICQRRHMSTVPTTVPILWLPGKPQPVSTEVRAQVIVKELRSQVWVLALSQTGYKDSK